MSSSVKRIWGVTRSRATAAGARTHTEMVSVGGGAIGYSYSGVPEELFPFINRVEEIEVTDNGPVWEGALEPEPDITSPSTPTDLTAETVSLNQIHLTWSASTDDVGVEGYKIYRDGTQIATHFNTNYYDTEPLPSTTYIYTVSAYDAANNESGQSNEASATTSPNDPPTAATSANPTSGIVPLTVNFTGSGSDTDGYIESYSWDFGNGETSDEQNPTHIYNDPDTYTVTLTVTDNYGATGSDTVTIMAGTDLEVPGEPGQPTHIDP